MGESVFIFVGCVGFFCESHDVGEAQVDIGAAAGRGGFVFTAEPAEAAQPAEGAFHDPAVWQNHEPGLVIAAFDNLQFPTELLRGGFDELAGIAAIGPDFFESSLASRRGEHEFRSVAILHAGGRDDDRDEQAQCLDQNVAFAALHFLARVVAALAARLGGLGGLAVETVGSRPSRVLTVTRKASCRRSMVPSFRQRMKYSNTVERGGKSCGNIVQAHPVRNR